MKWSEEDTFKFVELYREHECLWNMTKITYRNKNMRQKAIENIMNAMRLENFGVAEAKQKIKNIRSTYNQELQKIKKSTKSGTCPDDVYKPAVKWFHIMDQIMKGAKEPSETQSNLESQVDTELENQQIGEEKGTAEEPEISGDEQQSARQACLKQPLHEEISKRRSGQPTPIIPSNAGKCNKGTKRRLDNLSQAVNELRSMNQILTQPEPCLQENEAFGKYVASALNKLPQRQAILAQSEIQSILTRHRLNMISSPSSQPPSTYISPTLNNVTLRGYSSTSVPSPSPSTLSAYPCEQVAEVVMISDLIPEAWKTTNDEEH